MSIAPLQAQINPQNPPEPQPGPVTYSLSVTCQPAKAGHCSGGGRYTMGQTVRINTSANADYVFDHWTLNGEPYEVKAQSFQFTTIGEKTELVAHYRYEPKNPSEPDSYPKARLYLVSSPNGVASFNCTSGQRVIVGSVVRLNVYPNQGYRFLGWYENEELISTTQNMDYTMPPENTTLIASFIYAPSNPVEPNSSGQTDVDITPNEDLLGDINGDDEVDELDVRYLTKIVLAQQDETEAADINKSNSISIADIVALIELVRNK